MADWSLLLEKAYHMANAAHIGQTDKGGKPRIEHVCHVSRQFSAPITKVVAMLHDTLEDSRVTTEWCIAQEFGQEVADAVVAVTRAEGEKYFDYIHRCAQNPIARAVKIADIKHNMDKSRWPEMPDSYMEREIKALKILYSGNRITD